MSEEQAWHVLAGYIAAVAYMAFGFAAIVFLDSENGMWAVLYGAVLGSYIMKRAQDL